MAESIKGINAEGLDVGQLLVACSQEAAAEDIDLLGRLMQAMRKDAIRPGDKKMLMDILKRFVK